jgi:hypothetical protein
MVDLAASRILEFWISNIMHLNQARLDINNTAIFAHGTSLCSRMQRMCGQRCFKLEIVTLGLAWTKLPSDSKLPAGSRKAQRRVVKAR